MVPFSEVPVDGLPGRKALRQVAPGNAVFGQVEDRFYDQFERMDAVSLDLDSLFDSLPLRSRQVGGVCFLHETITPPGGFCVAQKLTQTAS